MAVLKETQVRFLSVYKKAKKKNAAKIIWLAGRRESRNLCRLTKLESSFKTESQTAFNRY